MLISVFCLSSLAKKKFFWSLFFKAFHFSNFPDCFYPNIFQPLTFKYYLIVNFSKFFWLLFFWSKIVFSGILNFHPILKNSHLPTTVRIETNLCCLIGVPRNWNFITINPNHVFLLFGHALILLLLNLRAPIPMQFLYRKKYIFMDSLIKTYNIALILEPLVLWGYLDEKFVFHVWLYLVNFVFIFSIELNWMHEWKSMLQDKASWLFTKVYLINFQLNSLLICADI